MPNDLTKYFSTKLFDDMIEWKDVVLFSPRRGSGKSNIGLQIYNDWMNHDNNIPMIVEVEMYE